MGDQLAKGWADSKAIEVAQRHATYDRRYQGKVDAFFAAERRIQELQHQAEVQAEEDMLP